MISITNVILIALIHLIVDFFLQTRQMGENKSKSIKWLSIHILVYSFATTAGWMLLFNNTDAIFVGKVFLLTFVSHFITDFISSKVSGYFYSRSLGKNIKEKDRQFWTACFWDTIGVDQFIHITTLLLTYSYLLT